MSRFGPSSLEFGSPQPANSASRRRTSLIAASSRTRANVDCVATAISPPPPAVVGGLLRWPECRHCVPVAEGTVFGRRVSTAAPLKGEPARCQPTPLPRTTLELPQLILIIWPKRTGQIRFHRKGGCLGPPQGAWRLDPRCSMEYSGDTVGPAHADGCIFGTKDINFPICCTLLG